MASNNSSTPRGRPATRQQTKYRVGATPSPPRTLRTAPEDYNIHELVGIPKINFATYWEKRHDLVEEFNTEMENLKNFCEAKSLETYWKFHLKHLELTVQRDFNTAINKWKEEIGTSQVIPEKRDAQTQTTTANPVITLVINPIPQTTSTRSLVPIRPKPSILQAILNSSGNGPVETINNSGKSRCGSKPVRAKRTNGTRPKSQPATGLGKGYTFHPYQTPQQAASSSTTPSPEQPQPSTSASHQAPEKKERRRKWKLEHPNYSYPSLSSSSGSDTEPLDC